MAMSRPNSANSANSAFTGVFLVGLGIIACFDYWWPGIMFVIAAAILVRSLVEGQLAANLMSIAILIAIGVVGLLGKLHLSISYSLWPIIFIAIGIVYLARTFWKRKE